VIQNQSMINLKLINNLCFNLFYLNKISMDLDIWNNTCRGEYLKYDK
jgi:hypothetical protein